MSDERYDEDRAMMRHRIDSDKAGEVVIVSIESVRWLLDQVDRLDALDAAIRDVQDAYNRPSAARTRAEAWRAVERLLVKRPKGDGGGDGG